MKARALPPAVEPDNFTIHWWVTFLLIAGLVWGLWNYSKLRQTQHTPTPLLTPHPADSANWFFVLRMPEVFDHKTQTEVAQKRLLHWLPALREAGFQPIRLSEAQQRLREGQLLPENSVVITFDPGYRHTDKALSPIFEQLQWPVSWLTPESALSEGNTHYLSRRRVEELKQHYGWDVIVYSNQRSPWAESNGKAALNYAVAQGPLYSLNVDATWTKQELINRLLAERPLREPSYLLLREIRSQQWGTIIPARELKTDPAFKFESPVEKRGTWLSWPGTRGVNDLSLDLQVSALTGELWLILRSDNQRGQGLRIAFANGRLLVEEERHHQRNVLIWSAVPALRQPGSFSAQVELQGDHLQIVVNGLRRINLSNLKPFESQEGVVRAAIYDKITGAAQVGSVKILATPHS